mmetsp:Transcript_23320/g.73829  ORF Transcript_23320/g.73829 Transcript_23320/m.73829 type:complete len:207 (+) Transcript_23320:485-1105(+)
MVPDSGEAARPATIADDTDMTSTFATQPCSRADRTLQPPSPAFAAPPKGWHWNRFRGLRLLCGRLRRRGRRRWLLHRCDPLRHGRIEVLGRCRGCCGRLGRGNCLALLQHLHACTSATKAPELEIQTLCCRLLAVTRVAVAQLRAGTRSRHGRITCVHPGRCHAGDLRNGLPLPLHGDRMYLRGLERCLAAAGREPIPAVELCGGH